MKLTSDARRAAVNRLIQALMPVGIAIVAAAVVSPFVPIEEILPGAAAGVLLPIAFALGTGLWLFVFNRGEDRVDDAVLEFSDEEIIYSRLGDKIRISWREISGFQLVGPFSRRLVVRSANALPDTVYLLEFSQANQDRILREVNLRAGAPLTGRGR